MIEKNENVLYMSEQGYQELLNEIEDIKKRIVENNKGRKAAFDAGAGDGWDSPEFEEIERVDNLLTGELRLKQEQLQRVVIVEKHYDIDSIDIGDIVNSNLIYAPDDVEEFDFKLVAYKGNTRSNITEVSINSPLGKAVYQKKVGETVSYSVNGNEIFVEIKSKNLGIDHSAHINK